MGDSGAQSAAVAVLLLVPPFRYSRGARPGDCPARRPKAPHGTAQRRACTRRNSSPGTPPDLFSCWLVNTGPEIRRCAGHLGSLRTLVFYALVSDEIERMIEFFWSGDEAEEMLARVLRDEPDWRD